VTYFKHPLLCITLLPMAAWHYNYLSPYFLEISIFSLHLIVVISLTHTIASLASLIVTDCLGDLSSTRWKWIKSRLRSLGTMLSFRIFRMWIKNVSAVIGFSIKWTLKTDIYKYIIWVELRVQPLYIWWNPNNSSQSSL
jgi:hypothetical protein